jgi:hypothetical protein
MRSLGLIPLAGYAIHAAVHLQRGEPYDLLWACHIAAILVGFGLLLRNPTLNAIGLLWSCFGLPLWLLDLATGGEFILTSPLTHIGAFACGIAGIRALGMPRHAAMKGLAAFAALWLLCRLVTPPAANVNLAFRVQPGWERYFSTYSLYFAVLFGGAALTFSLAQWLFGRMANHEAAA